MQYYIIATVLGSLLLASIYLYNMEKDCNCVRHAKNNEEVVYHKACQSANSTIPAFYDLVNIAKHEHDSELRKIFQRLANRKAKANDEELVQLVRKLIYIPRSRTNQLKLSRSLKPTVQTTKILGLLNQLENGSFIECGGFDGELSSATLYLEVLKHWTGLVIEPSVYYYTQILGRNRNVYSINGCLSLLPYFNQGHFLDLGSQLNRLSSSESKLSNLVPCFPLETILLALNWMNLNFLSLDVEGQELEILKTIPWQKTRIDTITSEYFPGTLGAQMITRYMNASGYKLEGVLRYADKHYESYVSDLAFSKRKI